MSLPPLNFVARTHTKSAWLLVDDRGLHIVYIPSAESREVEDAVGGSLKSQPSKVLVVGILSGKYVQMCQIFDQGAGLRAAPPITTTLRLSG